MSIKSRLEKLEHSQPANPLSPSLVCVDQQGLVLDNGTDLIKPWIGRHHRELPGVVSVVSGVDLAVIVGDKPGIDRRATA